MRVNNTMVNITARIIATFSSFLVGSVGNKIMRKLEDSFNQAFYSSIFRYQIYTRIMYIIINYNYIIIKSYNNDKHILIGDI